MHIYINNASKFLNMTMVTSFGKYRRLNIISENILCKLNHIFKEAQCTTVQYYNAQYNYLIRIKITKNPQQTFV